MKISGIISSSGYDFGILDILREEEVCSLGLASANLDFSFCTFIDKEEYLKDVSQNVKMIITNSEIAKLVENVGVCISENPRITFFKLHNYLAGTKDYTINSEFKTEIGTRCNINRLAYIAEKNIKIGNNVIIEEFVSIKENTIIGDNTIIRAGSIIGGEGFEFKRMSTDEILGVKHVGWSLIGKNVEIQQNSCVDKAIYPWDKTIIEDNCKLDNFVHIAHGVKLGKAVFIAAGVFTGGRTIIGENTWVGVGATVSNGLNIGKNSKINIGAVVTKDLEENSNVTGNFAIDHKKFIEFIKSVR